MTRLHEPGPPARSTNQPIRWLIGCLVLVAAVMLISDHQEHVFGLLPYLLLLACPLLHVFMHRGHGGRAR
jgi:hypothetical protein